ncbi:MAG: hypothetical protein IT373_32115, partial [Polyangiaceae bacterium]|nr:hypothetical protein [Polyangiaceae bacterium]
MSRPLAALAWAALLTAGLARPALAGDPAKMQRASAAFGAGVEALQDKQYELAASRFEEADDLAPAAPALRNAMRARDKAGQGSRAAGLAVLALATYADDADTVALAQEILAKYASKLHRIDVSCATACVLAVGTRLVHGPAAEKAVVFLDPGKAAVSASFEGGGTDEQILEARAGGRNDMRLESRVAVPPTPAEPRPTEPRPTPVTAPAPTPAPEPVAPEPVGPDAPSEGSGVHPAAFFVSLVATVGVGATTIWSGVDTVKNPGADAVRAACQGLGSDC